MIPNGDYYMTRDTDGCRCVWTNNAVFNEGEEWNANHMGASLRFDDNDEDKLGHVAWRTLLGRKCFGIPKGGAGWITVTEE